jgi:hypothetical protein
MDFYELVEQIEEVNSIIKKSYMQDQASGNPPIVDGLEIKHLWVHFGLNGSDYDTKNGGDPNDSFIQSIEHLNDGSKQYKKLKKQLKSNGFIYDPYFSRPIKFYALHGWYPLWQNPNFFKIYPQYLDKLKDVPGAIDFISKNQKSLEDHYVVFSDLLFILDRISKNIKNSGILKTYEDSIWSTWEKQVGYYKPTGMTIANAQAQEFIRNKMNAKKYSYLLNYENIPIILSSQFSGGALCDPLYGLLNDLFSSISTKKINEDRNVKKANLE